VRDAVYFCRAGVNIAGIMADGTIAACRIFPPGWAGQRPFGFFRGSLEHPLPDFPGSRLDAPRVCAQCSHFGMCRGNSCTSGIPSARNPSGAITPCCILTNDARVLAAARFAFASRTRICGEFLLPLENSIGTRPLSPVPRPPLPRIPLPRIPLVGVGDAVGVSDGVGVAASRTRICGEFLLPLENSPVPRRPSPSPVTRHPLPVIRHPLPGSPRRSR
jgi:radical SAM protein with 4Fe4S-binding SPASM domain